MHKRTALKTLCRVCGYTLKKGLEGDKELPVLRYEQALRDVFDIDVSEDNPDDHLITYCHPCRNVAYFRKVAKEHRKQYNSTRQVFHWEEHTVAGCTVYNEVTTVNSGGRPKNQV